MSDRRGVMLLMFDLPVKTSEERRIYSRFRKTIIRRGYTFFQRSVYIRLLRNISSADGEKTWVEQHAPEKGIIHVMSMNLNAFKTLEAVRGEGFPVGFFSDDVVFVGKEETEEISDDRLLELDAEMSEKKKSKGKMEEQQEDEQNESGRPDWIFSYKLPF